MADHAGGKRSRLLSVSHEPTITTYSWIGILVIATTTVLAALIARAIRKQNQLAKLKNDLVATITHELKNALGLDASAGRYIARCAEME